MKEKYEGTTNIEFNDHEFLTLVEILHRVNSNIEVYNESKMQSDCTFVFDTDYGMYDSFRELMKKVYRVNVCKAMQSLKEVSSL